MYKKLVVVFCFSVLVKVSLVATVANPYETMKSQEKFQALTNYLVKKDLQVDKPIFPYEPSEPAIPTANELTKGKYEKIATFQARVAKERQRRAKLLESLQDEYAKDVKNYNEEVKRLTDEYNNNLAKKQKQLKTITLRAM